ncbi:acyl-CoA Delta(11) desaturase-like [Trichoplusia ni]|uniref:Acyl-CoA Delta(11) desaturase-like n=1 Tax=Trichoplusia ni TaxID=7111 RepID=A0A7E5W4Y1_TRINI|nr:acyl-CoA Delta(11) desaturase-like [Trichoplusia ni]
MGVHIMIKPFHKIFYFQNKIKWTSAIGLIFYHVFGAYWCWLYAFPFKLLTPIFAFLMLIVNGLGITCGVHRLFTHKSYKVNTPLKILLILFFTSAGQNSIYQWVRDHRLHHKFSDTDADPHNSRRGLFFSHIGWLMMHKNEEVRTQGKKIDMSDIENDAILMFQDRNFTLMKLIFCYVIPTTFGIYFWGEEWKCAVAWQCFIRYLSALHCEMTVNSLAHAYGYQPYNKHIAPKENGFVATITIGEGFHNYHHVFPFDYKAAEYFDTFNWSAAFIRWWEKMGWAYDLKEAKPEMIDAVIGRTGDVTLRAKQNKTSLPEICSRCG